MGDTCFIPARNSVIVAFTSHLPFSCHICRAIRLTILVRAVWIGVSSGGTGPTGGAARGTMTQTKSAIIFSALSAVLAAAPAHSLQNSDAGPDRFAAVEFSLSTDAALVFAGGSYGGNILADLDTRFEWETISDNGWRWGFELGLHAQSDMAREGFANTTGPVLTTPQRSLATGRYRGGAAPSGRKAFAAERLNVFLKAGWGEWRLGLTPGAAQVEAVNLPTGSAFVRLDGGPLGLGRQVMTRTANTGAGFGPSLVYSTPRIIGLRASASFAPQARFCGVDICLAEAHPGGAGSSSLENVFEAGISFDHTFAGTGRIEAALNVVTGEPLSVEFQDNYSALGAQVRWSRDGLSLGVSGLWADNAVSDGRYQALAAAARYDVGDWSFGVEAATSSDDYLQESETALQFTLSRLVGDHHTVTFGLHSTNRDFTALSPQGAVNNSENGSGAFLELTFRH
ncbi:MAG: porin [Alphaproteobacteria bacterium]|nr:porin [Alphaproteobacteria bacterium]